MRMSVFLSNAAMLMPISAQASAPVTGHEQAPQTAATSASIAPQTGSGGADDIVVTARRRDESLSKVPIAISVLGSDALASQAIRSESDLQAAVPGLLIKQAGSSNAFNYAIRGQSIDAYSNSPPSVLPYINDVQINTLGASSFYDLANIQVLKGPQGTLFGRNTTGGAVLYKLREPDDKLGGFLEARYGRFDSRQVTGAITLPLAAGVSLRLAGNALAGGAYVRNLFNGKILGNLRQTSARATLRLDLADFKNTTTVQYTRDRGTGTPSELYSYVPCGATNHGLALNSAADCLFNPANPLFQAYIAANPGLYPGGIAAATTRQQQLGPWITDVNGQISHRNHNIFVINSTEISLTDSINIKNIFGFNSARKGDTYDFDGTPYVVFDSQNIPNAQLNDTRQFSNELQVQGQAFEKRLNYVVGFYYLNQRDIAINKNQAFGFEPVVAPSLFIYALRTTDESLAGFAQATYKATDRLSVTGGFRYSHDALFAANYPFSVFGASMQKGSNEKPSWTASLDYQVTSAMLVYVTTRGSWRTGGYNYSSFPIDIPASRGGNIFLPETTHDVELGAKYSGRLGDVPVSLNVDIYNQWVDNIQRASFLVVLGNSALVTNNAPKAQITGFEGSLSVKPARWLQAGANLTYTDARFTDGNTTALNMPISYGPFGDVPKWTGSVFAQITRPLAGNAGTLSLRSDLYAQSSFYFSNLAATLTPGTTIPHYNVANARLGWSGILGSRLTAALYMKNIFNKDYYVGGLPTANGLGINSVSPGSPRMFGGELRVDF